MIITVTGETELRVAARGDGLQVEEVGGHFGPLPMLAASLGTCTVAVLASWAENVGLPVEELEVVLRWEYAERPYRVGAYESEIVWPGLPEERRPTARRVAATCTVHHTLERPPELSVTFG